MSVAAAVTVGVPVYTDVGPAVLVVTIGVPVYTDVGPVAVVTVGVVAAVSHLLRSGMVPAQRLSL